MVGLCLLAALTGDRLPSSLGSYCCTNHVNVLHYHVHKSFLGFSLLLGLAAVSDNTSKAIVSKI